MPNAYEFLVVDDNRDNRFLLAKTLERKFPTVRMVETDDGALAIKLAREHRLTAAIVHRAADTPIATCAMR